MLRELAEDYAAARTPTSSEDLPLGGGGTAIGRGTPDAGHTTE